MGFTVGGGMAVWVWEGASVPIPSIMVWGLCPQNIYEI